MISPLNHIEIEVPYLITAANLYPDALEAKNYAQKRFPDHSICLVFVERNYSKNKLEEARWRQI